MSFHRPVFHALAASTFLIALSVTAAEAADPNDVANRLKAVLADQGLNISWAGVSGDSSQMVLSNVTASVPNADKPVAIGNVTLSDVKDGDNGAYVIGKAELPNYSVSEGPSTFDMEGVEISGLKLPGPNADAGSDPLAGMMMYDKAEVKGVSVKKDDKEIFSLSDLHVNITPPSGDEPLKFDGAAEDFSVDLTTMQDQQSRDTVEALGYNKVEGYLDMAGSWSPKDGKAILDKYDLSVKNAGTLSLSLEMSGYTPAFLKQMRALQKQMAANPTEKSAQGMAMLGLMQQLSFDHASVSYQDDSLTGKVMDFVARKQKMQRSDIVNQAKAILPFALAQLNNPDFTAKVTQAVSTFLDDPKNLTIEAAPPAPVPFAMLMAGAMTAPQQLPQQLGVSVTANK